jgi:aminoglycoside 3-N-acetyltransferase
VRSQQLSYRDLITVFRALGLRRTSRVLVHVSLPALGPVAGGADTLVGSLLSTCEAVVLPSFTEQSMLTPVIGPPENGLAYGAGAEDNLTAEFYHPDLPTRDVVAERLRHDRRAERSMHPLYSFVGVNADEALQSQSIDDPLAPVGWLADFDGDVLLLGANHKDNVALHYAERAAGRKQFIRWALTPEGVVVCPNCPGCSEGFPAISDRLAGVVRLARLGTARVELIPLRDLIHIAVGWIRQDPRALLCEQPGCSRCQAVRASVRISL